MKRRVRYADIGNSDLDSLLAQCQFPQVLALATHPLESSVDAWLMTNDKNKFERFLKPP